MRRSRSLAAVAAVGALVAAGATASPATAGEAKRKVQHTQPRWIGHTKSTGRAPSSGRSDFKVYLQPRGGMQALQAAVDDISTPGSATYHRFGTPAQFHARFDPTDATVGQVSNWLKSQGLKVTSLGAHNDYVGATGSNAAVGKAFGTQIRTYDKNGATVQANDSDVSVPDAIAGAVSSVSGLDTSAHLLKPAAKPSPYPPGFRNGTPCSTYYGQKQATTLPPFKGKTLPYSPCGYTGPQFRGAYEGSTPLDGSGVTIAITDAYASPTIAADASLYAGAHGDRTYAPGQLTQSTPRKFTAKKACDPTGWYGEETLDVEAAHAMAQGANIAYYASASCNDDDFLDTLDRVVADNRASIVSNSWGGTELNSDPTLENEYNKTFLQGNFQGISFLFSSGDNGDEAAASGVKQADTEGNNPNVTAVGGTADAINAANQFSFQTGWGTHKWSLTSGQWTGGAFLYGAGGGVSTRWGQPKYQKGVVPAQFSSGRAEPDVAMDADPTTGMLVGETQSFPEGNQYGEYRIGGTSLASPLFAGLTALRQQATGPGYDNRLGFLNPSIYTPAGQSEFTDVRGTPPDAGNVRSDYVNGLDPSGGLVYTVRTFNEDSSLATAPGWDEVTGVGAGSSRWITP